MSEARLNVTSARHQPLNCLLSLKVGSTFLRNLIYVLDHNETYSQVEKEFPTGLRNRELTKAELAQEVSFYVVRDPVMRFFSLYFDKVVGKPENHFEWIIEKLKAHRVFHEGPDLSLSQHRDNCMSLLGFLRVRVRGRTKAPINPHWNKQIIRVAKAIEFGLHPLMLENLETQLLQIADGRIEGLERAAKMVKSRNRSPRPLPPEDILTREMHEKICALYPEDIQLYDLVKTGWEVLGRPPEIKI
ncbi:MAG: sulfotransferase family protein [Rhodobacteraceae bacterium]|nr:sulfotransferase family protein [Paracoccaceae bacterium]